MVVRCSRILGSGHPLCSRFASPRRRRVGRGGGVVFCVSENLLVIPKLGNDHADGSRHVYTGWCAIASDRIVVTGNREAKHDFFLSDMPVKPRRGGVARAGRRFTYKLG